MHAELIYTVNLSGFQIISGDSLCFRCCPVELTNEAKDA